MDWMLARWWAYSYSMCTACTEYYYCMQSTDMCPTIQTIICPRHVLKTPETSVPVRGRVLRSDWPSAEVCRGVCSCLRVMTLFPDGAREPQLQFDSGGGARRRLCVYRYDINALSLQWSRWQHLHRLSDASTRDVWRALAAAAEGDSVFVFVRVSVVVWTEDRILRSLTLLYSIRFYSILFSVVFCFFLLYSSLLCNSEFGF